MPSPRQTGDLAEVAALVQAARTSPLTKLVHDHERLATLCESLQMRLARTQTELRQVRSDYESLAHKYQNDVTKIMGGK